MKEMREEKEKNERGKRKGERNGVAIGDTSLDFRKSNDQNSSEQEAKFIYAARASCKYQDPKFSSNSKRYRFLFYSS